MKINEKQLGKLVRVVLSDDRDLEDYVYAFPVWVDNWLDFAADHEYWHCNDVVSIPPGTYGTVVAQAFVGPNVTINYAKVLFPKTIQPSKGFRDGITVTEAGAYWISGQFLELVPEDEY